jgi:pimeloyl-ACP methyl ester carboxylesterase
VVCPSLPGYAFSEAPRHPGLDQRGVALEHLQLMANLGYPRYGLQGGDWGSAISTWHATLAPERVVGLHLNLVFAGYPKHLADPMAGVTEEERLLLEERRLYMKDETGYQQIQGTRPQTLGYGLNDSPIGLASWIAEKFRAWTDCRGVIDNAVRRDDLLTNIMLYWVTGSITSSTRLYYESRHSPHDIAREGRVTVPTACALFPAELYQPPRRWAEERYNVVRWSRLPAGGHFPALEQPALLTADLRAFFAPLRARAGG